MNDNETNLTGNLLPLYYVKKNHFYKLESNIFSRFILTSLKNIYTLDFKLIAVELFSINSIKKYSWERETCYDTTLFISTFGENLFIIEYTIFPSIHLNKRWPSSIICKENQVISDMKSNENNHGRFILVKDGLIDVHL
ncbi:unnamed protein product [Rotaria sp. Silwood1]|nr:unnamed protein product [Rotaria sp. Silwood1]